MQAVTFVTGAGEATLGVSADNGEPGWRRRRLRRQSPEEDGAGQAIAAPRPACHSRADLSTCPRYRGRRRRRNCGAEWDERRRDGAERAQR